MADYYEDDDDSSWSSGLRMTDHMNRERDDHQHRSPRAGNHKTKNNARLVIQLLAGLILVILPIAVPVLVFRLARSAEQQNFQNVFEDLATKVRSAFGLKMSRAIGGIDSLAIAATSHVLNSNQRWPNVALPDFNMRASSIIQLSGVIQAYFIPMVQNDQQRREWIPFVKNNLGWINGPSNKRYDGETSKHSTAIFPYIYTLSEADGSVLKETAPYPYFPVWQQYPLLVSASVNYNLRSPSSNEFESLDAMVSSSMFVLTTTSSFNRNPSKELKVFYSDLLRQHLQDPTIEYKNEPSSSIYFPVFDSFRENRTLVGVTYLSMFWPHFLKYILPESPNKVFCVFENPCSDSFTIEIDGDKANFLGYEDLHNPKFDKLARSFDVADITGDPSYPKEAITAQMNEEHCPYTIRLYPTDEMYDAQISYIPIVYAVSSGVFFSLVALIVSTYGLIVHRRSKRIVRAALTNGKLAESIFPENLRRRLRQIQQQARFAQAGPADSNTIASPIKFLELLEQPVADQFANVTILFACIDGFDEWCIGRDPKIMFELLETYFLAFDDVAKKHNVFKIETIADSFVAATGLPDPQPNHILLMTNFAKACMRASYRIKDQLTYSHLDMSTLHLRIGIHSGQVTAGVMGGEKSRFQVFGDTVNLASRMMSTGRAGKVHLSDASARLLLIPKDGTDVGVRSLLCVEERRDKINVKGKGLMTTHWLRLGKSTGPSSISTSLETRSVDTF